MQNLERHPPRYVPTLTDVVAEGLPIVRPEAPAPAEAPVVRDAGPSPAAEPVQALLPESPAAIGEERHATAKPGLPEWEEADLGGLHAELVARLMERMQPLLEERLRYAVADIVRTHTDALAQNLRAAVEEVVRNAVADAVAEERSPQQR